VKATSETYRVAALEQIRAAEVLWDAGQYVLANYVAGLAVECMLRAYATRNNPRLWDTAHHDLRIWYKEARFDLIVPNSKREIIGTARSELQTHWTNRQRYSSLELLRAEFKDKKLDRGIRGDAMKELTKQTKDAASEIVLLGEAQWMNSKKKLETF
jgi:hypothetical protein